MAAKIASRLLHRRFCSSAGKGPSNEEIKLFVDNVRAFLLGCQSTMHQKQFAELLKEVSASVGGVALNNRVLYPAELSNLVATFVPIGGSFMPHNSKVVAVDLERRLKRMEVLNLGRNVSTLAMLLAVGGFCLYWPSVTNSLQVQDQKLLDAVSSSEQKTATILEAKVASLERKSIELEQAMQMSRQSWTTTTTLPLCVAGVGVVGCVCIFLFAK